MKNGLTNKISKDKFSKIRIFLNDIIQQKPIALITIKYLGKKIYLKNASSRFFFRGALNDIEDINKIKTTENYWLGLPRYSESLDYLRSMGFTKRSDIELMYSLLFNLPKFELELFTLYLPKQAMNDWSLLKSFVIKRELKNKQFEEDLRNGLYDREGFDESPDDGFNHIA